MAEEQIYFIGLALPEPLNSRLSDLSHHLHAKYKGLPPPLLPHITLLHPPSLHTISSKKLKPRIRDVAQNFFPIEITLTKVGFFNTQVCFVHVESQALHAFQRKLVALLPIEVQLAHYSKRSYVTHITLARTRRPLALDRQSLRNEIEMAIKLPVRCTISEVSYFERYAPRKYHAKPV